METERDDSSIRWAEDRVAQGWREDVQASEAPKTAVPQAPSKPYFTDEYEPTDPNLWERCLAVVNGELREFTRNERTIHAPNHGHGYRHMPNPKGIAWAVKQYDGFGGGWKSRKEAMAQAHAATLRVLAHGGVVSARTGEFEELGKQGLVVRVGQTETRDYWDISDEGLKVAAKLGLL